MYGSAAMPLQIATVANTKLAAGLPEQLRTRLRCFVGKAGV